MSDFETAKDNLITVLQAVTISATQVFQANSVYFMAEGEDPPNIRMSPRAVIRSTTSDAHENENLHYRQFSVTIEVESMAGPTGSDIVFGHGNTFGLEQIAQAVRNACDVVGPSDTNPVAPILILQNESGPDLIENGSSHTMYFEGFLAA